MPIQVCTALAIIFQFLTQEAVLGSNATTAVTTGNVFVSLKAPRWGTCEHAILSTNQMLSGFARGMNDVNSLDLSDCGINGIFNGALTNLSDRLQNLSLAYNNISIIHEGVFQGMKKLAVLNLAWNPILEWNGNIQKDLPQLKTLVIRGIKNWKPDNRFLGLTALVNIKGPSWNPDCASCSLIKNYTVRKQEPCTNLQEIKKSGCISCPSHGCQCTKYIYSNYTLLLAHENFAYANCNNTERCYKSLTSRTTTHPCLSAGSNLFVIQSIIGVSGLLLNAVVVANVVTTRKLRENVSLLLTCNMAFCDFLNCLYAVSIFFVYRSLSSADVDAVKDDLCPIIGCVWLLGQSGVAMTSVMMTFERYCAVTFATNPKYRLRIKQGILGILLSWSFSLGTLSYALFHRFFSYNSICVPLAADRETPSLFRFSIFLCLLGSLLYIINIPLYVQVYLVVRKSSRLTRVKREAKVAGRIALLVVTNMIFFFLPIFIYGSMMAAGAIQAPGLQTKVDILVILIPIILPMYCLALNSCFNPFLYAFRNRAFREAMKSKCSRGLNIFSVRKRRGVVPLSLIK